MSRTILTPERLEFKNYSSLAGSVTHGSPTMLKAQESILGINKNQSFFFPANLKKFSLIKKMKLLRKQPGFMDKKAKLQHKSGFP